MSYPLLIVGGTGLVASAIIREAKSSSQIPDQSKHRILALSRSANSKQSVDGVNFVQGNALDPQSLQVPLESNPNVVHTVGTLLDQSKKYGVDGSYDKVNRDAAISVADAMAEKYDGSHRRCMVYFSASKAPPSFMLNERYLQTKREAEEALLGSKYKDKLRVVVFRPGMNFSIYYLSSTKQLSVYRSYLFVLPSSNYIAICFEFHCRFSYVEADVFVYASGCNVSYGQTTFRHCHRTCCLGSFGG